MMWIEQNQPEKVKTMSKKDKWNVDDYEVISVTAVDGMCAVYAYEHPTEKGKFYLHKEPLHFVGVVKVTTKVYERVAGQNYGHVVQTASNGTKVVGIDLSEGYFTVCNEADNFAGIMLEGDKINDATGCLNIHKYPLSEAETP